MKDFEQRLLDERNELSTKVGKLGEFINSDKFASVGDTQMPLLVAQHHAMIAYESILSIRIKDLKIE